VPSQAKGSELEVSQHYMMLVYPFRHAVSGIGRAERLHKLAECWRSWWSRLSPHDLEVAKDDTHFFLPYVRELLFPELCFESALRPSDDTRAPMSQAERLSRLDPGSMANLPVDAVIRLTFSPDRLSGLRSLQLELERKGAGGKVVESFSARFALEWVDAVLFPQNTGFLVLKLRIDEDALTVGRARDFQYYIRLVQPPNIAWTLASWRKAGGEPSFKFNGRDLVDYLLQGLAGPAAKIEPDLGHFLEQLAQADPNARYTTSPQGKTYGRSFNMFMFCLLKDAPTLVSSPAGVDGPAEGEHALFESPSRQALYELATCTDSNAPDYVPHPLFLKQLWDQHYFAHWENWQSMALQDNVVFLGTKETGFTRYALGHNVESDYFALYLFALFQKTRLSVMFGELMMRDSHLHRNLKKARRLWNAFLAFQDHYWFSEVTRSRQGTELYRHYQEALDVTELHSQISAQMRELQGYYEGKVERRVGRLMNFLTFIGIPTTIILSLFTKSFFPGDVSISSALLSSVLIYLAFFVLWTVWTYYIPD
jgi:hypothetical protein